jgi:hypothetical protein
MTKVDGIVEELQRKGFSMTKNEFYATRVYKILEAYGIDEKLTVDEYILLVGKLFLICK